MTEENSLKPIRVGSRKSELALIQTKHVISQLRKLYPEKCFEIHTMSTIGDRVLNVSLPKIGEKSLFTRDLEDALRNGGVDFVVHSLKDLPTALPAGMAIGAVLEREDSRDALVLNEKYKGNTIDTLPAGCVIGTSSLRRTAQLRRLYPHLEVCDIRGNLNTRLAKLDAPNSKFAGIILAQAGLIRMGWMSRISQILEPSHLLYAVGQGALAVECRSNDEEILEMLQNLMCLTTTCRILAERSFLKTLGGGCSAPVAVTTELNGNLDKENGKTLTDVRLNLTGAVWSLDGSTEIKEDIDCYLALLEKKRKRNESIKEQQEQEKEQEKEQVQEDKNENDDGDDEGSPRKRIKSNNDENLSQKQRGSPKIVNDDKFLQNLTTTSGENGGGDGSGDANGNAVKFPDIEYLINIHGELFKKCPFYVQHQKDRENGNTSSSKTDECPLNIPIGQDFMGKCPYLDVPQKVELSEKFENKCPITGMIITTTSGVDVDGSNSSSNKNGVNDVLGQGDTVASTEIIGKQQLQQKKKCPFTSNKNTQEISQVINNNNNNKTVTLSTNDNDNKNQAIVGHEICPFIQQNYIKLIDCDAEKLKMNDSTTTKKQSLPTLIDDSDQLFCGLYRHKCYKYDLFQKCEQLGRQLAENLIKKGALDVMKCAQQEIREKL